MKKIAYLLLVLVILFSPINKFFISVGIRIQYSEFLSILFIMAVLLQGKPIFNKIKLDSIHAYIYLQWIYILPIFVSLISFLYIDKSINELFFFIKGFAIVFFFLLFISCLLPFLQAITEEKKKEILDFFIYAIFLSGIYGILQIVFFISFSLDFDKILSNTIPLTGSEIDITASALGSFFRLNGFTSDPSVQASISILVITLLSYYIFVEKKYKYIFLFIIILLCFILTMSGSGLIGLSASFAIIIFSRINKISLSQIFIIASICMPIIILAYIFREEALFFLNHKFQEGGTTKVHAEIAQRAFNVGMHYPIFGVGYNNFSFIYEIYYGDPNYNAHNSWLNYFVETGFLGFFYKIMNAALIIFLILRKKSNFKFYFLAGFIGLNVSSFGYETLNLFFNQTLIFVLLYFYLTNYFDSSKNNALSK